MNIEDILEMIDDLLDKAAGVPFSGKKVMVDGDKIRDLLNEVRLSLPQEIKHARMIVHDRQTIINDANKEAEAVVRKAEERAKSIVSNEEIVKLSKQRGVEIMNQAASKAKDIRAATNEYIDNILGQTEDLLASGLVDLKKTRQAIRMTNKNPSQNG